MTRHGQRVPRGRRRAAGGCRIEPCTLRRTKLVQSLQLGSTFFKLKHDSVDDNAFLQLELVVVCRLSGSG